VRPEFETTEFKKGLEIRKAVLGEKAEGHLGRCYLKGRAGDAANAILSAIGYNFRRILAWLRIIVALFLGALSRLLPARLVLSPAS
jgi:IS5 family transposase